MGEEDRWVRRGREGRGRGCERGVGERSVEGGLFRGRKKEEFLDGVVSDVVDGSHG